jgi:hypothetical protein
VPRHTVSGRIAALSRGRRRFHEIPSVASFLLASGLFLFPLTSFSEADTANRVTILYDAFGNTSSMTKAWSFSALVECSGERILFDTGGNAEIGYLLRVSPTARIYEPAEPWGPFGWDDGDECPMTQGIPVGAVATCGDGDDGGGGDDDAGARWRLSQAPKLPPNLAAAREISSAKMS